MHHQSDCSTYKFHLWSIDWSAALPPPLQPLPLPRMAVGPHVELAPLTDALPACHADDYTNGSGTVVSSSSPTDDAACKEDLEHDVQSVTSSTRQQWRPEVVR